jgi:hypothetical protein
VLLYSSTPSNVGLEGLQREIEDILKGKKLALEKLDGAAEANREQRSKLWGISGKRAVYPQLFARAGDGSTWRFIGDGEGLKTMVELETLDAALKGLKRA